MIQKIFDKCPKIEEKWQKLQWSILKSFDFLLLVVFLRCSNAAPRNPVSAAIMA